MVRLGIVDPASPWSMSAIRLDGRVRPALRFGRARSINRKWS